MALGLFSAPVVAEPLKRITAASFSRVTTFEKCPQWAYQEYAVKRPKAPTVDNTAGDRGNVLHKQGEDFVTGKRTDAPDFTKVNEHLLHAREQYAAGRVIVEQEWAFDKDWQIVEWFAPDCWLRIKCDVVFDPGEIVCDVWDWKSGRKDGNEIKHIGQGQLYCLAVFMRYPATERATATFRYIDHGKELSRTYTRADVPRLLEMWNRRLLSMTDAGEFKAKPNKINCAYCPWSGNNGGDASCPWRVTLPPKAPKK